MYVLLFRLNGAEYGILLKYVCFIEKKRYCGNVGCTEEERQIAMVRGNVVPVYSLALHFGYAEQEANYLMVVTVDDVKIALGVSSIDRAIWVEKEMVKLLPAIAKTAQSCFREVLVYEERLIGLLDISSLSSWIKKRKISYEHIKKNAIFVK